VTLRIAILQPGYLPWEGFFEQMDRVDRFILLDDVLYTRRDWRSRNRILAGNGPMWLTVPVKSRAGGISAVRSPIQRIEIDNAQNWVRRHLRSIELAYARAPHFDRYIDELREVYAERYRLLVDLDEALRERICGWLGIATPVLRSSCLPTDAVKAERIVALCKSVGATHFYSGAAAVAYLDAARFADSGIELSFQDYHPRPYPQLHADSFVSHLSVLDLLFNLGQESLAHIRHCGGR
jgi:hypothetical protein